MAVSMTSMPALLSRSSATVSVVPVASSINEISGVAAGTATYRVRE